MDYRDNRQRWAESHQVVHFYGGQWCTFTPALTTRIARVLFLRTPPRIDANEITDKGYINQRAVLSERAALVDALYSGDPQVIPID